MTTSSPVHGLSRRSLQHGFRQVIIEVDEQCPTEREAPLQRRARAFPRSFSGRPPPRPMSLLACQPLRRRPGSHKSDQCRDQPAARSSLRERALSVSSSARRRYCCLCLLFDIYSQPGARVGVHYLFRPLAGAHDHGRRPARPEAQPTEPRHAAADSAPQRCRWRGSQLRSVLAPAHHFHHFVGSAIAASESLVMLQARRSYSRLLPPAGLGDRFSRHLAKRQNRWCRGMLRSETFAQDQRQSRARRSVSLVWR